MHEGENREVNLELRDKLKLISDHKLVVTGSFAYYLQLGLTPEESAKKAGDIDVIVKKPDSKPKKTFFFSRKNDPAEDIARSNFDIVYGEVMPNNWERRVKTIEVNEGYKIKVVDIQDIFTSIAISFESTFTHLRSFPIYDMPWLQKRLRGLDRVIYFMEKNPQLQDNQELAMKLKSAIEPLLKQESYADTVPVETKKAVLSVVSDANSRLEQLLEHR